MTIRELIDVLQECKNKEAFVYIESNKVTSQLVEAKAYCVPSMDSVIITGIYQKG